MAARIVVNKHIIKANLLHGRNDPPLSIQRSGKPVVRAYAIEIVGSSRMVYNPARPLKCGATVWLECDDYIVTGKSETEENTACTIA
jgi:hypothetical protein